MAIFATLPGPDLFSTLPTTPPPSNHSSRNPPPKPPIPVPKYPPPLKKTPKQPPISPAFKTHHQNSKYFKPIKPGQKVSRPDTEDRSVIVGNSGISYQLPGAPFEFMYSYSETPKAQPVALREPAFLPFAPPTMPRPWTGKAPMKKSKRNIKLFEPLGGVENNDGRNLYQKRYEMLRSYELGNVSLRPREEVLGEPLTRWEIKELLKRYLSSNRQVNLGRDGLTHNMLELIHTHWRRQPVCKVRCLGVPTVDMDNICRCLEERAGGKIIHRAGGVVYIFRGRNYDHQKRPKLPVMLWKPAAPVYPKLVQDAPEGLTKEEADNLRNKGKSLLPICKLAKNGVYISLVTDVRTAFEGSILVKINCKGLDPSDYKKIGAKLKELVPCVLLSFDDEHILMWRGKEWKSMYIDTPNLNFSCDDGSSLISKQEIDRTPLRKTDGKSVSSSPKMMSLWQCAIESGKASVLDEMELTPDDLLSRVEEFDLTTQAMEHSYPATIHSNKRGSDSSDPLSMDLEDDGFRDDDGKIYINDSFDTVESSVPLGSLPVDFIAKKLIVGQGEV